MRALGLAIMFALRFASTHAMTLEVPQDYATIQEALAATLAGDTVRVAPGTYHEFLSCSTNSIVLLGWYPGDTLAELRTLLDPVPFGIDTPSVLQLFGDTAKVLNFAFFNRPEMRETNLPTRTGGILFTGEELEVRDCRFDSVSYSIEAAYRVTLKDSKFIGCKWPCVYATMLGVIKAENCEFDGSGATLVTAGSASTIENCSFRRSVNGGTNPLKIVGEDIVVRNCSFGPSGHGFSIIVALPDANCRITDCVFYDITGTPHIIEVAMNCPAVADTPIVIANNTFLNCRSETPYGGTKAIGLSCQTATPGYFGVARENIFIDCEALQAPAAIGVGGSATIDGNRFERLVNIGWSNIWAGPRPNDTIVARDNLFLGPGVAASSQGSYFDARENWWGDSTGPYHLVFNPEGQGTEVGNGVEFIPWLTAPPDSVPDTSGTNADERSELPSELSLSVFPNPFNPATTISFTLKKSEIARLELFDILGRLVVTLADDMFTAGLHEVQFNGVNHASGVYLAKLSTPQASQTVKLLLLK